jgi:hypothetical protein
MVDFALRCVQSTHNVGEYGLLINEAINSLHLLFRPLMLWWIIDKEICELKLSDVYLKSIHIKKIIVS